MTGALDGLRILVPETRELDLFVGMLEKEGAVALRCPLVRILDLADTAEAEAWIARLVAGEFKDVVWLTGEGLRRLLPIAERTGRRAAFIDALGAVRSITRGPKPVRALRELGLVPGLQAAVPTSQGVIEALAGEDLSRRPMGVQLYPGDGGRLLLDSLAARGAIVFSVTPYCYASAADTTQVAEAIRSLTGGKIDMIAFTSSPQAERLFEVARETGLERELHEALARVRIAAIGPVVEETLQRYGAVTVLRPESAFHLKPFVRTIAADWQAR
jgi:uroporphyrinogen-III synthase